MDFAERLKELRKANGYTQITLAEALGLSKGTVAMWETGKRTPDYEIIKIMSDMFDRRIDYILGYSDDDSSPKISYAKDGRPVEWEIQNEQIDIFRQYLRLDAYGRACVDALIRREAVRCADQGTEQDISGIRIGIQKNAPGSDPEEAAETTDG
ncbi:MAG: helix-turn-helix domain-containing protein [Lachnospiraceae bacterium]|nr:helix-turn-helix domain-containing protein [Lachnospiraceae bacterium]